ncbi:MAG: efflux RND transporter periplasmic adaptor subunit [Deltaproteobacteria bacterium]|nr:efflux RND transporter periplasmic adaptor subunit [Deltaproteobacteria bacterium]
MKHKYIIVGILVTIVGCVGLVLAISQGDNEALEYAVEQKRDHGDHDHEPENDAGKPDHDEKMQDKSQDENAHNPHAENLEEGGHDGQGKESGIVEMKRAQQEEIGLTIAIARSGDIKQSFSFVGEVRLNEDRVAHIVPMVQGVARSVPVSLGEKVSEGQVLALLASHELAELKADYMERYQNRELTRHTFERKKYLKQENIASEADLLEAQSAFQNAQTILRSATYRLAGLGFNKSEIRDLADGEDEAFGTYTLASPITGTIIAKHITHGEKVGEEEVFTVADLSVVWVDLQIPPKDLGQVKEGMTVEITSTEGRVAKGKLALIGPLVNEESRTTLARIVLPNLEGDWMPGLFVKGQILGGGPSSTVVVPSEALQNIDGRDVVFVPEGDGFIPVEIATGKRSKDKTEILSGLKPGNRYVAKGAFQLKAVQITSGAGAHAGHGH